MGGGVEVRDSEVEDSAEVGDGEAEDGVAELALEEEFRRKGMMSPSAKGAICGYCQKLTKLSCWGEIQWSFASN